MIKYLYLTYREDPNKYYHSKSGSNSNEEVLHTPQSSRTETSLSDGLVSYPGHLLGSRVYSSAEMHLMYSTAPADWS